MMTHTVRGFYTYLVCGLTLALVFGYSSAVSAQSYVLNVPSTGTIRGVETPHMIGRTSIPEHYIGTVCSVSATSTNDLSVHPESDLRIASGGSSITLTDVERQASVATQDSKDMRLGDIITLHITSLDKLGYSADVVVRIDCPETPVPAPTETPTEVETPDKRTPEVSSPEPPATEVTLPGATEALPRTGPGSLVGLFFATSLGGSLLYRRLHK